MSGAEALGVIASATQLAAYGIKIALFLHDISKKVHNAPAQITAYVSHIRHLIETTTLIEQHESLQSSIIHTQLQTTLLEARSLYNVLKKLAERYTGNSIRKYWISTFTCGDREILTAFTNLEREKTTLGLCVSLAQTDLLLNIQSSLNRDMSNEMADRQNYTSSTSISQGSNESRVMRVIGGPVVPVNAKN